ncbi:hypothetical protein Cpap_0142 [Ruminiclostridium papyrosolvens DSM 2782]|uniref:Transcriptional regulator, AbrB family n=1 Tax=Ruminiclostridium papyrosolvens DSM 2782 TaxID=588581 RepID=F1TIF8_9FIRM|nr:AbrB/MazE/SpoVT family DNA-binding domain-containing protein [Ruminiclostridium papyrosolvens]EGD45775.1 hypothetical protein Cpap_0142 [Ruminiclostridium papyrosolvens DSM 2782]WES33904.1 AbrB/MazE/SpoVT family DNA-binding domain-containing protein [Ruminiclostridium papyrosolvens DSM 2782]
MKMIEIETSVNEIGEVTIPAELMRKMGFASGDTVKLSFVSASKDGMENSFKEFVVTPDGIANILEDNQTELTLPLDILEKAEIPYNSDLEVICAKGAVVITEADLTDRLSKELRELFEDLGISKDTVSEVLRNGGLMHE